MQLPLMSPAPGERCLRFVGDHIRFAWRKGDDHPLPNGCRAFVRTNLGRAQRVRDEIIRSYTSKLPSAGASWRDIEMQPGPGEWSIALPLTEVGFFQAKAYLVDEQGRQHWPEGPNVGITVHPDQYRTANIVYCAFVRLFGETKSLSSLTDEAREKELARWDKQGYTVIPPSGKLRDLIRELPHILGTLGCRILHLLPINPPPTTYARFGRYGSPYASLDLTAVDPALVEFDRRTTGIDQFRELTYAAHLRGAKVFLDIVTNHTGWGSPLQENHPDWFLKENGRFVSPGAWGVTWEDLVELNHRNPASWEHLAEVFLTWCRRGVDGFRCDAGYKVPMAAWRYITACVRQEFPETIFLLEGLGGSWEATESLLTDGGMQWAYSELFQNYSGKDVANYLDYALSQSRRAGLYIHYSETHDNDRLAKVGRAWSRLRNQLCGLTSPSGGYGFTCGVEWLAAEKINVHANRALNWGAQDNLLAELSALNRLLTDHPCFFDNARCQRLSAIDSPVYALRRDSEEGFDRALVLANNDTAVERTFTLDLAQSRELGILAFDLLGGPLPKIDVLPKGEVSLTLAPGAAHCLSSAAKPLGLAGEEYRRTRACAAWAVQAISQILPVEAIGTFSWKALAGRVAPDPAAFLTAIGNIAPSDAQRDLVATLDRALAQKTLTQVVRWELIDARRVTPVPPRHWLLVQSDVPFRATLSGADGRPAQHAHSIGVPNGFVAFFPPQQRPGEAALSLERYAPGKTQVEAAIRFLSGKPELGGLEVVNQATHSAAQNSPLVLLTNGRGGMARINSDLGRIQSKYDCLLGANLHPSVPVDRHVFAKRLRAWLMADRFLTTLDQYSAVLFSPGPPAHWQFVANAGDGRTVPVQLTVDMLEERNTTVLRFTRPALPDTKGTDLPASCDVRLTVRIDLEDRNFHWETKRDGGAEYHFASHCRPLAGRPGFEFTPAPDRVLRVFADAGEYHHEAEWSENIPHPVEQSRGQTGQGDAYSPGWFDLPLPCGQSVTLVLCSDPADPPSKEVRGFITQREATNANRIGAAKLDDSDQFGRRLVLAAHQFLVRRGEGKTVVAGYPWFLDWGRDTLICARGLLAAGLTEEVKKILITFGRFEENGTIPNSIYGEDASNRDTSDAPLWFGVVCEEAAPYLAGALYDLVVDARGRTLRNVLRSIAEGYLRGTPNGIRVDPASGLVWSPTHFTWMDTNFPAGTPREGYPVEIQALWIRLLRQLGQVDAANAAKWRGLAAQSLESLLRLFWSEKTGHWGDCLLCRSGQAAGSATLDTSLRSNYLFAIAFGLIRGERARQGVEAALKYLVVPGALRTLAPLPVSVPLPIQANDGRLLNNPLEPYWGRYEGDEDTRRKPAYHNGTAWTWTFPTFCEALAKAWDCQPSALSAAKAYLASMDQLLTAACLGQLPEIVDGDAPHLPRGCDAQAWGVTEALRVWSWIQSSPSIKPSVS